MIAESNKMPLTVIVPVRNEEKNISACLESVAWADQVFVVDSQSEDRTVEISRALGAEVVQFHYDGGWPKKKNWALRNLPIRNEWVFILDADERIDDGLRQEVGQAIQRQDVDGFYVRWKFIFLGRWMKHCWRHGWMLRLIRHGAGEYEDLGMRQEGGWDNEVHENIVICGNCGKLESWLIHDSEQTLSQWISKQNEFSDWNAVRRLNQATDPSLGMAGAFSRDPLKRRKFIKSLFLKLPFKPFLVFAYLYIFRFGWLDGREGYYFSMLRACHEVAIEAKQFERQL